MTIPTETCDELTQTKIRYTTNANHSQTIHKPPLIIHKESNQSKEDKE